MQRRRSPESRYSLEIVGSRPIIAKDRSITKRQARRSRIEIACRAPVNSPRPAFRNTSRNKVADNELRPGQPGRAISKLRSESRSNFPSRSDNSAMAAAGIEFDMNRFTTQISISEYRLWMPLARKKVSSAVYSLRDTRFYVRIEFLLYLI